MQNYPTIAEAFIIAEDIANEPVVLMLMTIFFWRRCLSQAVKSFIRRNDFCLPRKNPDAFGVVNLTRMERLYVEEKPSKLAPPEPACIFMTIRLLTLQPVNLLVEELEITDVNQAYLSKVS